MHLEIRWFYKGSIPRDVNTWFRDKRLGENIHAEETREDIYLQSRECEELGIKLREGKLEIKWRGEGNSSFVGCKGKAVGKVESWTKWAWEDSKPEKHVVAFIKGHPSGPWITVAKQRLQRWYNVTSRGSLRPLPVQEQLSANCAIELTGLMVKMEHWWTLALDAYGEPEKVMWVLDRAVNFLLRNYDGPKLQDACSYGYPKWLSIVSKQSRLIP